jgi:hypothetical protein
MQSLCQHTGVHQMVSNPESLWRANCCVLAWREMLSGSALGLLLHSETLVQHEQLQARCCAPSRTCSAIGTSASAPRIVTRDATVCGSVSSTNLHIQAAHTRPLQVILPCPHANTCGNAFPCIPQYMYCPQAVC